MQQSVVSAHEYGICGRACIMHTEGLPCAMRIGLMMRGDGTARLLNYKRDRPKLVTRLLNERLVELNSSVTQLSPKSSE